MSYRRSYTGYVSYSGSVSYPASQNGGTAYYSGEEPVYITIDVDTDSFDNSVAQCNNAVHGLTAAVVATEAAQIESKRRTSIQIATSIVKGFFEYVSADLSQKLKELSSKCESLFVALMGHKESCIAKNTQMQDDYNRITKRYSKIFEDLDKETNSRIETLDRATFQFAGSAQKVIERNTNTELLGISTVSANENIKLGVVLSCSHIKRQASKLLSKTNDYLYGTYKLANSIRDMLYDNPDDNELLVPVMFVETCAAQEQIDAKIYGTNGQFTPSGENTYSYLISQFMSNNIEWGNMDTDDYDKVITYLNTKVQADKLEDRVLRTMLDLMNDKSILTIKNI